MVDDKGDENVVSYGGMLCEPLTLYWRGDRQQIIHAIEEEGFNVVHGKKNDEIESFFDCGSGRQRHPAVAAPPTRSVSNVSKLANN